MTIRSRLYALLITVFILPFLIGGILLGFYAGEKLQQAGFLSQTSWAALPVDLALAIVGIYLGGLAAYIVFCATAITCFSRDKIEPFSSQLPQGSSGHGGMLRAPFSAVGNFFWPHVR